MNEAAEAGIVAGLRASRKYRDLCDETLTRVARWALERYTDPAETLKAAKRKLHQIYGAFLQENDLKRAERAVATIEPGSSVDTLRPICRDILALHASTRERTEILDGLFPELFDGLGTVRTILDCACGLNPFSMPWMGLSSSVRYIGTDINTRLVSVVNDFFRRTSFSGHALCHDLLCGPPPVKADVVLLLKTFPTLEQQCKGGALQVLNAIRETCSVRCAVVSFPARSLGGRAKGMHEHYGALMDKVLSEVDVRVRRVARNTETFHIVVFE